MVQDTQIQCPADVDATEAEVAACEAPKPVKPTKPGDGGVVTPQGGGGGTGNPPQPK